MHVNAIARNGAGCEPYSDSNVKEQSYVYIVYMIRWLPVFCLRAASTRTVNTIPFRLHSMRVRFVFVSFLFHVVDRILSYSRHFDHFYKKKKINNNTVHACIQKQNKNDEYIPGFHFASILESYSHTYSFKLIMDFGLSSCNEIHLCVFYIGNITKETKSEKNDERKTLKRKPNFMKQTKTIRTVQNLSKIIFRFFFVCTEDLFLLFSAIFKNQPEKKHWTE